jgi:hypothetical protein
MLPNRIGCVVVLPDCTSGSAAASTYETFQVQVSEVLSTLSRHFLNNPGPQAKGKVRDAFLTIIIIIIEDIE